MANTYLHGAYGNVGTTLAQNAIQAGTIPVYIGTAPIHLVRGYAEKNLVNRPVKLTDWKQAVETLGYSDDWEKYTLCEVMKAHFNNPQGNIGPIYVINVLDPDTHKKSETETATLAFTNKRAEIASVDIIVDTLTIADKAEGVDYSVEYDSAAGKITITDIKGDMGTLSGTFSTVDTEQVKAANIVGGVTTSGEYSGIAAIELLYNNENQVATLLAAPGWSHDPAVHNALVTACQKMNGHWMAYCFTDIPLEEAATIEEAIAWKQENGYNSKYETVCWPQVITNTGETYHLSTLSVWRQMMVDFSHDSVPFETASNKAVPGVKQYFGDGAKNAGFDKQRGNALNEKGIRTVCPHNGQLVLWGGHTAAFTYGATTDANVIFDTNIMMQNYILNSFQRENGENVDKPMIPRQLKDDILNREQDKLDDLVARGALIGDPQCVFLESENSTTDMVNGDFKWNHIYTPTPQLKSASTTASYTDAGFTVYTATE